MLVVCDWLVILKPLLPQMFLWQVFTYCDKIVIKETILLLHQHLVTTYTIHYTTWNNSFFCAEQISPWFSWQKHITFCCWAFYPINAWCPLKGFFGIKCTVWLRPTPFTYKKRNFWIRKKEREKKMKRKTPLNRKWIFVKYGRVQNTSMG